MRKAMIVFLVAMILLTVCFGSLHGYFLGVADDVTVVRNTLYGDPAAAEGVSILVRNQYDQNLLWETSLTLDGNSEPQTAFTFSNQDIQFYDEAPYTGLEFDVMSNHVFYFNSGRNPEYTALKYAALTEAIRAEEQSVAEGESKTFTIDYAKYLDYYPLDGQVILPNLTTVFSEFESWIPDSDKIAKAINDFFRIPLDGIYTVDYTFDREGNNRSYGASVNLDYHMDASGVATSEACYFTFNTVKEDGTVVDTSLIPGGYGIYRLPYDENGLQFDAMEMVYALDPSERYDSMSLSADGKRIRMLSWQGDDQMLTVIDLATMTQLQKVKLVTQSEEWWISVICYDDFILIVENRRNSDTMDQITVWEEISDGTYSHALTANMNMAVFPEGANLNLFDRYSNAVDYRDGKLVLIKHRALYQDHWHREYADIYVTVYDASGMLYAGTCEWNLTQANVLDYSATRVYPTQSDSLEVSW